jgi:hypothetical protein
METFYALTAALVIAFVPILLIAAMFFVLAIIAAPIALRVLAPCKNMQGKLLSLTALVMLIISWLILRGRHILQSGKPFSSLQFEGLDVLLLLTWIVLALSLFVWPGYTKRHKL